MADNTLCSDVKLDFTATGPPRCFPGNVDHSILTPEQEDEAFDYQERVRRQDLRYLQTHPEVRAITSMIIKLALTKRPPPPISVFFADFFSRPRDEIEAELKPFLETHVVQKRRKIQIPDIQIEPIIAEQAVIEKEEAEVEEVPSLEIKKKSDVFKNLDRLRKNIRISISKSSMPEDLIRAKSISSEMIQGTGTVTAIVPAVETSVSGLALEAPPSTISSTTSLVFSQSIEDFLISMQVKQREMVNQDQSKEYGRQARKHRSFMMQPKRLHIAQGGMQTQEMANRHNRERTLKDLKVDTGVRPRRSQVTRHKSGLYTVMEVDETQD